MRKQIIEGRCYKRRTQRGLFRMKKKSLEDLQRENYRKTGGDFYGEEYSAKLVGLLLAKLQEERGELAAEKREIIQAPEKNPAVWLPKKYPGLFFAV